jgi:hypothetical protein
MGATLYSHSSGFGAIRQLMSGQGAAQPRERAVQASPVTEVGPEVLVVLFFVFAEVISQLAHNPSFIF